jgi:hypothetical protein
MCGGTIDVAVLAPHVLVPVVACAVLDRLRDLADGAEDHLEGVELLAPRRVGAREAKVRSQSTR